MPSTFSYIYDSLLDSFLLYLMVWCLIWLSELELTSNRSYNAVTRTLGMCFTTCCNLQPSGINQLGHSTLATGGQMRWDWFQCAYLCLYSRQQQYNIFLIIAMKWMESQLRMVLIYIWDPYYGYRFESGKLCVQVKPILSYTKTACKLTGTSPMVISSSISTWIILVNNIDACQTRTRHAPALALHTFRDCLYANQMLPKNWVQYALQI